MEGTTCASEGLAAAYTNGGYDQADKSVFEMGCLIFPTLFSVTSTLTAPAVISVVFAIFIPIISFFALVVFPLPVGLNRITIFLRVKGVVLFSVLIPIVVIRNGPFPINTQLHRDSADARQLIEGLVRVSLAWSTTVSRLKYGVGLRDVLLCCFRIRVRS